MSRFIFFLVLCFSQVSIFYGRKNTEKNSLYVQPNESPSSTSLFDIRSLHDVATIVREYADELLPAAAKDWASVRSGAACLADAVVSSFWGSDPPSNVEKDILSSESRTDHQPSRLSFQDASIDELELDEEALASILSRRRNQPSSSSFQAGKRGLNHRFPSSPSLPSSSPGSFSSSSQYETKSKIDRRLQPQQQQQSSATIPISEYCNGVGIIRNTPAATATPSSSSSPSPSPSSSSSVSSVTLFQCNSISVPQTTFDSLVTSGVVTIVGTGGNNGTTPGGAGAAGLPWAVRAAILANGLNVAQTTNMVIPSSSSLPSPSPPPSIQQSVYTTAILSLFNMTSLLPNSTFPLTRSLAVPQQQAVLVSSNVTSIDQIQTIGQLLSPALLVNTLQLTMIFTQLGFASSSSLFRPNTTCGSYVEKRNTTSIIPSSSSSPSSASPIPSSPIVPPSPTPAPDQQQYQCICPFDYAGDHCEYPLHYECAVVISDPTYSACIALNGYGFDSPVSAGRSGTNPQEQQQTCDDVDIDNSLDITLGSSRRRCDEKKKKGKTGVALPLKGVKWLATSSTAAHLGKSLGIAPPSGKISLFSDGIADTELDVGTTQQQTAEQSSPSSRKYNPVVSGDPPCMYLDKSSILSHLSSSSSSMTSAASKSHLRVAVRIICGWRTSNVTNVFASGKTVVDPLGRHVSDVIIPPFTSSVTEENDGAGAGDVRRRRPSSFDASLMKSLRKYSPPPVIPSFAGDDDTTLGTNLMVYRCNGTAMTRAYILRTVAASPTRDSATSLIPPYFGLQCVEQKFQYMIPPPLPPSTTTPSLPSQEIDQSGNNGNSTSPSATATANRNAIITALVPIGGIPIPFALSHPLPPFRLLDKSQHSSTASPSTRTTSSLALRIRGVSSVRLGDSSLLRLFPLNLSSGFAAIGQEEIVVDIGPVEDWVGSSSDAHFWAGGRLNVEMKVVMAPLGVILRTTTLNSAAADDDDGSMTKILDSIASVERIASTTSQNATKNGKANITLADELALFYAGILPKTSSSGSSSDDDDDDILQNLNSMRPYGHPLLVLSNVLRVMIDDSSYTEPTHETTTTRAIRLTTLVGIPLLMLVLSVTWCWRRYQTKKQLKRFAQDKFGRRE